MKKFFSEYGFVALTVIAVVMLIGMVSPIGAKVKENMLSLANKEGDTMETIADAGLKIRAGDVISGEEDGTVTIPVKGDLITIEGAQYRVLSMSGTQAKVLAMTDATEIEFNDSSVITSFNGSSGQKYEGSKIDNYLENEWFAGLSQTMKDAIVAQDIEQNAFVWKGTPVVLSSWYKTNFAESDTSGVNYTLSKTGSVSVGSRHVFALDIQDVIDYLGSEFNPQDLNEMFWQQRSTIRKNIWLRSAHAGYIYAGNAFRVVGPNGSVDERYCTYANAVRPAFVIDLSKIEFTK